MIKFRTIFLTTLLAFLLLIDIGVFALASVRLWEDIHSKWASYLGIWSTNDIPSWIYFLCTALFTLASIVASAFFYIRKKLKRAFLFSSISIFLWLLFPMLIPAGTWIFARSAYHLADGGLISFRYHSDGSSNWLNKAWIDTHCRPAKVTSPATAQHEFCTGGCFTQIDKLIDFSCEDGRHVSEAFNGNDVNLVDDPRTVYGDWCTTDGDCVVPDNECILPRAYHHFTGAFNKKFALSWVSNNHIAKDQDQYARCLSQIRNNPQSRFPAKCVNNQCRAWETVDQGQCEKDDDCALVRTGCSCVCGSIDTEAINKKYTDKYKHFQDCPNADAATCASKCEYQIDEVSAPVCQNQLCIIDWHIVRQK